MTRARGRAARPTPLRSTPALGLPARQEATASSDGKAEVPVIPECATQGETFEDLLENLYETVEGCLSVDIEPPQAGGHDCIMGIAF